MKDLIKAIEEADRSLDNKQNRQPANMNALRLDHCLECGDLDPDGSGICEICSRKRARRKQNKKSLLYGIICAIGLAVVLLVFLSYIDSRNNPKTASGGYIDNVGMPYAGPEPESGSLHVAGRGGLVEDCKNWLFLRRKIMECNAKGDEDSLKTYRASFQQTTERLNRYNQKEVSDVIAGLEGKGF